MRTATALAFACLMFPAALCAREIQVEVSDPRSFGYVVGDTLERRITVTGSRDLLVESESLPPLGRQSAWFTLLTAELGQSSSANHRRYELRLRYQLRNAPTQTRSIALPSLHLRFSEASETVEPPIGAWQISIAPIIPANASAAALSLRPDRRPQFLSSTPAFLRMLGFVALAVAILAYLYIMPRLQHRAGPFARADRIMRRRVVSRNPSASYQAALRALHRAFDETAGERVFADRMTEFFAEHPQFAGLRESTEQFLQLSRQEFFAVPMSCPEKELSWLTEFCRACRSRERGTS
jgi:mxaA protein